jgi:hypothetical protein
MFSLMMETTMQQTKQQTKASKAARPPSAVRVPQVRPEEFEDRAGLGCKRCSCGVVFVVLTF